MLFRVRLCLTLDVGGEQIFTTLFIAVVWIVALGQKRATILLCHPLEAGCLQTKT